MRVLCAPNAFKGSLTAHEAARAIARGARRAGASTVVFPVADGGDGTATVLGGARVKLVVTGPYGERLPVEYRMRAGGEAVVEVAQVGLARTKLRDPMRARSDGVGEMIRDAIVRNARRVVLAVGGSATVDGGAGMVRALGGMWYVKGMRPWTRGGPPDQPVAFEAPDLRGCEVVAACDVGTRLDEAAGLFGPQKGATPDEVRELARRLEQMAGFGPRRAARLSGSGAAGGIGWAVAAQLGGRLQPGAAMVLEALGFDRALRLCDLVLTGEGRWDRTTSEGKAPWAVVRAARRAGIPAVALCGQVIGKSRVARAIAASSEEGLSKAAQLLEDAASAAVAEELAAHRRAHGRPARQVRPPARR